MTNLDEIKSLVILGDISSCKTNLAVHLLRSYLKKGGKRQVYIVGYPKQIDNFKKITFFNDLFKLTNSIIFIDEIQRYIKIYDRKANYDLMELISLFAHNNNTLIFTTCLSQFISKSIESYIDGWFLTRILDLKSLKNGSKAKRIIEQTTHPKCSKWSLALLKGEYLEYSELNDSSENTVKIFPYQGIEKDWKVNSSCCQQNKIEKVYSRGLTPFESIFSIEQKKTGSVDIQNHEKIPEDSNDLNVQINATKKIIPKNLSKNSERLNSPKEIKGRELSDKEISKIAWGGKCQKNK